MPNEDRSRLFVFGNVPLLLRVYLGHHWFVVRSFQQFDFELNRHLQSLERYPLLLPPAKEIVEGTSLMNAYGSLLEIHWLEFVRFHHLPPCHPTEQEHDV